MRVLNATVTLNDVVSDTWNRTLHDLTDELFNYQMVKPLPSEWVEENIILPEGTTAYPGPFSYDRTPYCREIIDNLYRENSPTRHVAVMKGSQSGLTAGVIVPGILYTIAIDPDPILFTAGDLLLAAKTIEQRIDPILRSSGLEHFIRPAVVKKGNSGSGDTKQTKQFPGGQLHALGTNSANSFRMFSVRVVFADDWDTAPRDLGNEGSPAKLIQGRQKSYGKKAITFYVSTPTSTSTSNIYEQYLKGSQKKWNWHCPCCSKPFAVEFVHELEDKTRAGLVYKLDEHRKLIKDSIRYRTPCCKHDIRYEEKHELNLAGVWIATNPEAEDYFESYQLNDIFIPIGFDDWEIIIAEWLAANPPGQPAIVRLLKAFNNQRLGLPFEEKGVVPKSSDLQKNTRGYPPGYIPDSLSEADLNGPIILLTLAADFNGELDDARIDWEILAHAATGATYSVNHGSIGTFQRSRDKKKTDKEKEAEGNRQKYTYQHNADKNAGLISVWPDLKKVITTEYPLFSEAEDVEGAVREIDISALDCGFQQKHVMQFITDMQAERYQVFGVIGRPDVNYRKTQRDSYPVKKSNENPKRLYVLEVNQLKYDLAESMKLREGEEGSAQPAGFMNFPEPNDGKYQYSNFFLHYEGEKLIEEKDKNDDVIGYKWEKKNSQAQNHFWDVRVYNNAAPLIYLDLLKQVDPTKYKHFTWQDFVLSVID